MIYHAAAPIREGEATMTLRVLALAAALFAAAIPSVSSSAEPGWWGPPAVSSGFAYAYGYPGYGVGYSRYRYGYGPMYVLGSRCGVVPYLGFTSYRPCRYRR
jgi:hypothetical protein